MFLLSFFLFFSVARASQECQEDWFSRQFRTANRHFVMSGMSGFSRRRPRRSEFINSATACLRRSSSAVRSANSSLTRGLTIHFLFSFIESSFSSGSGTSQLQAISGDSHSLTCASDSPRIMRTPLVKSDATMRALPFVKIQLAMRCSRSPFVAVSLAR